MLKQLLLSYLCRISALIYFTKNTNKSHFLTLESLPNIFETIYVFMHIKLDYSYHINNFSYFLSLFFHSFVLLFWLLNVNMASFHSVKFFVIFFSLYNDFFFLPKHRFRWKNCMATLKKKAQVKNKSLSNLVFSEDYDGNSSIYLRIWY